MQNPKDVQGNCNACLCYAPSLIQCSKIPDSYSQHICYFLTRLKIESQNDNTLSSDIACFLCLVAILSISISLLRNQTFTTPINFTNFYSSHKSNGLYNILNIISLIWCIVSFHKTLQLSYLT